jgi:hypothetical protein
MSIVKRLLILLLLTLFVQRLSGQTNKQTITSWVPSSVGLGFESTAYLPKDAEIRILVVTTGHWPGEVVIYPESRGNAVAPVARWLSVKNAQILVFQISHRAGGRFFIQAGTSSPYQRPGSCSRHGDYDQLTFEKGWVLNVKVLHEF